jgi:hypothetical protein
MNHDWIKADMVEEGERGGQGLQVLGDNRTTNLDHSKLLR